jgi:hypothetical protein
MWWVATLLVLVASVAVAWWVTRDKTEAREGFVAGAPTLEERVMDMYASVLQRQPSAKELIEATRNLHDGTWTEDGLRQRLIDSDEYQRLIKTQSNGLAPELQKMVADRALVRRIAVIFAEERKAAVPAHLVLPLKDVYVMLDYNEYSFRAFLRSAKFDRFSEDVRGAGAQLEKEGLQELVRTNMGSLESIAKEGEQLARDALAKAEASAAANGGAGAAGAASAAGAAVEDKVCRSIDDKDSDMTPTIRDIVARSDRIFNKDELAKMLDAQYAETYRIPTRLHHGDMVLRPEMSWSVPQPRPPVCTTLGQPSLVQPTLVASDLMLGTPLEDARATGVGSMMPAFEFKEFVPLQVATGPATSNVTATAAQ